nr:MAG: hypothetical protein [Wenzhou bat tapwovirus 1]
MSSGGSSSFTGSSKKTRTSFLTTGAGITDGIGDLDLCSIGSSMTPSEGPKPGIPIRRKRPLEEIAEVEGADPVPQDTGPRPDDEEDLLQGMTSGSGYTTEEEPAAQPPLKRMKCCCCSVLKEILAESRRANTLLKAVLEHQMTFGESEKAFVESLNSARSTLLQIYQRAPHPAPTPLPENQYRPQSRQQPLHGYSLDLS